MDNVNLSNPIFHDEIKAREWLESVRWANGAFCAHCGSVNVLRMEGEAHREGLHNCRDCRKQFSVTVGTVYERSHVPLHKWVLANYLMNSSKKGISAAQISRTVGVTYKTAWFMAHRIREAMTDPNPAPIGGEGKVIEADEMYHGKAEIPPSPSRYGRPYIHEGKKAQKRTVIALVERAGEARAVHLSKKRVTAKNVAEVLIRHADVKSTLHTDESNLYPPVAAPHFAKHEKVRHADKEYARGKGVDLVTTNSVEGFFGVFKRGFNGIYQHCGEQHFQRYLDEYTFRYNYRVKLGYSDMDRAIAAMKGIEGKRLTYRRISAA